MYMNEKSEGEGKPFYQDIVSRHKRTSKPPKSGKEGSENAGRSGGTERPSSQSRNTGGQSRLASREARPGSDTRFRRSDGSAPRSDNRAPRVDNHAPRADSRAPRADSHALRSDNRAPRSDSRGPRVDNRAPRVDNHAPRADSRTPRRDGRGANSDNRSPSARDAENSFAREEAARESRTNGPVGVTRPTSPMAARRDAENNFARNEVAREKPAFSETRPIRKPFTPPLSLTPVFGELSEETRKLLDAFPEIIDAVFPLDAKKEQTLSGDIRDLSHELTDERGDRRVGYMNEPAVLSAYIRYYMWWNLIRISRLLVSLPIVLNDGDAVADLGSGPLTVPIALWMTRADLREKRITWYCVDISQGALAAGEELFLSLAARTGNEPWRIVRVKGESGVSLRRRVALVTTANMFNELFWDNPMPLEGQAIHHAGEISSYAERNSSILVIEPGVPRAARFVSLMRDALITLGFKPDSPCPHLLECPFPGLRHGKWCHFAFDTADAPAALHKLSLDAGLAKDRAALSFVFAQRKEISQDAETDTSVSESENASSTEMVSRMAGLFPNLKVRITSDPIRLPEYYTGRYGCSELGMVMLTGTFQAADYLNKCESGSLVEVPMPDKKNIERDGKTGAFLIRLK